MPEMQKKQEKTILWLVRHGQTDWNLEGRYQGQADTPLNSTGIEEAGRAARQLADRPFRMVYSSDLQRAKRTAEMIAQVRNTPVRVDPRLREISLGEWEGQIFDLIQVQYPLEVEERKRNPLTFRAPGGESIEDIWDRVKQAVNEITEQNPGNEVVLVAHGIVLAVLLAYARDHDISKAYARIPANAVPEQLEWPVNGLNSEGKNDHAS
jgi:alpha-ribazole phosphatase